MKTPIDLLPWPRFADDDVTPLGVDLARPRRAGSPPAYEELRKLVASSLRTAALPLELDDVVQSVALAIVRRNRTSSAYDPRLSSFGHYIWQVAGNVVGHLMEKRRTHRRERLTDDLPELEDEREPLEGLAELDERAADAGMGRTWILAQLEAAAMSPEERREELGKQMDLLGDLGPPISQVRPRRERHERPHEAVAGQLRLVRGGKRPHP
jgi:DNA-directed RNA polymerase specialized sigma24 family protein